MATPNLDTDRLQVTVNPDVKAKLHYAAALSRPQTTMGALAAFLIEDALARYIADMPDLDQQRIDLRMRARADQQEGADEEIL